MEAGPRGAQKLPLPREGFSHEPGPGLAEAPTRPERGGRSKLRRRGGARGEEAAGRPARSAPPPAGRAPAAAGKQGKRGADAGRSEQLFSWLSGSGGGEGLGRWPRARETVFFV